MSTQGQRPADWKFTCAYSGMTGWASDSALTWQGYRVLKRFLGQEGQRHPQEGPPVEVLNESRVAWSQPEAPFTFRSPTAVQPGDL